MEKKQQFNFWYLVIAMMAVIMIQSWVASVQTVERIPYSEFLKLLGDKKVTEVVVLENSIRGKFTEPHNGRTQFVTTRVDAGPGGGTRKVRY